MIVWVSATGLKGLRRVLRKASLQADEDRTVTFSEGGFTIYANPKASHGYLYLGVSESLYGTEATDAVE
jgi:hypothetical protein